MHTTATLSPIRVEAGEGRTLRVISDVVTVKASAEDTGGAYSLFETSTPPGGGTPPHYQRYEDEAFYVLEGRCGFRFGEDTVEITEGGYAFVPRGTVHAFTNAGDGPLRMIVLVTPGGIHEKFFAEVGEDPATPAGPPDIAKLLAAAPKYGIEILPVEER